MILNKGINPMVKSRKLRIISPSGAIQPEYIMAAADVLGSRGYEVSTGKYALSSYGRFAGTDEQRLYDLQLALDDPTLEVILCSRGGYGLSRIIDKVDFSAFLNFPKWLVGFSDVTVLHCALSRLGVPSIHGSMARYLAELPDDDPSLMSLQNLLEGHLPTYLLPAHPMNRPGKASATLIGGNLSVLMSVRGTPYEPDWKGAVLFVEEVGEEPYHIDRMMQNLRMGGVLQQLAGIIVGRFTDCPEDSSMQQSIAEIIRDAAEGTSYPICFDFPAGHEPDNYPLILGAQVRLEVGETETQIDFN